MSAPQQRYYKALEEIWRLSEQRTRYGATARVHPDVALLKQICEIARKALVNER